MEELALARVGDTFNQYRGERAGLLRERLDPYLREQNGAHVLLVGEAAGYRGARVSGIPFTSERQLTGMGPAEATATIVHCALAELGLGERVLLWNLVPTHPHRPGRPLSTRPPAGAEIELCRRFVSELAAGRGSYRSAAWPGGRSADTPSATPPAAARRAFWPV